MDDFAERCTRCSSILSDDVLPMWQRIDQALSAWKGLSLSDLSPKVRPKLERHFVAINAIFSRYQIANVEDYQLMSLDDLDGIADELRKLARLQT